MSATNENELAAIAGSDLAVLPPAERAARVMGSTMLRIELTALAESTKDIVAVIDKAGRKQVHNAAMVLVKRKTGIKDAGEGAREDANKFSKAVIAEQKALTSIIEPEETRLLALRDAFDAEEEAREQAKIAAEHARAAAITDRIAALREDETDAVRIDKTAEQTRATLEHSIARPVTPELFEERYDEAVTIHAEVVASIRIILAQREADEAAAAKAEADRLAAAKALEDQRAEQARVAAEQAATAKRLADAEAELQRKRDADAAAARAAQLEVERLAKVEADKVAAANAAAAKVIADAAADLAAKQAGFQRKQDEAAAADKARADAAALYAKMNKHYDAAIAEDAARTAARIAEKQVMVDDAVATGREQAADERVAGLPAGALGFDALADSLDTYEKRRKDVLECAMKAVADTFGLTHPEALEELETLTADDFYAARTLAEAA